MLPVCVYRHDTGDGCVGQEVTKAGLQGVAFAPVSLMVKDRYAVERLKFRKDR